MTKLSDEIPAPQAADATGTSGSAPAEAARGAGRSSAGGVRRVAYQPRRRVLTVARVEDLGPTMRRIVLTGDDLEPEFPFWPLSCTDHIKLCVPDPATGEVTLPEPGPGAAAGLRDYTIRHVDAATRELTVDAVLHDHGPAGRWALSATPGTRVGVLGPRGSQLFPSDVAGYLLVADETGLPALERFLEELPAQVAVTAVVLAGQAPVREIGGGRSADVHWLPVVSGEEAETAVLEVLRGLDLSGDVFAWGAGEAGVMRAVRRFLRNERSLPAGRTAVRGYWRTGAAGALPPESD